MDDHTNDLDTNNNDEDKVRQRSIIINTLK